jgi:hypothetical protein
MLGTRVVSMDLAQDRVKQVASGIRGFTVT